jgi:hypothetical protein
VSWSGDTVAQGGAQARLVTRTVHTFAGDGRFIACGVPRDRPIDVRVEGRSTIKTTRLRRDQVVGIVDVAVSR